MTLLYQSGHVPKSDVPKWYVPNSIVPKWTCTKVGQNRSTTSVHIISCTEMVCTEMDMYRTGPTPQVTLPDGKRHPEALRWVSHEALYTALTQPT